MPMTNSRVALLFLASAALLLSACGPSGPPKIKVNGKITFGGGDWPKPATLDFTALKTAEGMPNLPQSVVVQGDGKFTVDLVPGEYVVNTTCWEVEMTPDNPNSGKSYIPKAFREGDQRPKVSVPLGAKGPIEVNWDIPKS